MGPKIGYDGSEAEIGGDRRGRTDVDRRGLSGFTTKVDSKTASQGPVDLCVAIKTVVNRIVFIRSYQIYIWRDIDLIAARHADDGRT
jgi:hypothetical protein